MLKHQNVRSFFDDERLEDTFLIPNHDDEDRSESIPTIWSDYFYKEHTNGVKVITNSTAKVAGFFAYCIIPKKQFHHGNMLVGLLLTR